MTLTGRPLLCATDFSPAANAALDRAARLAVQHGQPLHLVHVFDWTHHALRIAFGKEPLLQLRLQEKLHATLKETAAGIAGTGATAECELVDGKVASGIVTAAAARQAGLVVLGAHGEGLLGTMLGSTVERVLRQGATATLVVRQHSHGPYRRVLVATDFSAEANAALRAALALAPEAALTVLTVYDPIFEAHVLGSLVQGTDMASISEQARQFVAGEMADAVRLAREVKPDLDTKVIEGNPWRGILQVAEDINADLIVMGRRGQGRVEATLLGSATRYVLAHSKVDVLVTHAD